MHPDKSTLRFYYKTFTFGHLHCGPTCVTHVVPRVWPTSIASPNDFPAARAPSNPPTKTSPAVRIDDLLVLENVDGVRLDVIGNAGTDSNCCTMGKYDNTVPGGVGSWFLGESPGDGEEILRVGKTVRACSSLRFYLVTDRIIDIGKDISKLGTENLDNEGGGEVEDEDLGTSSMGGHIQGISGQFIPPFPSPGPSCLVPGLSRYRGSGGNPQHKDIGGVDGGRQLMRNAVA